MRIHILGILKDHDVKSVAKAFEKAFDVRLHSAKPIGSAHFEAVLSSSIPSELRDFLSHKEQRFCMSGKHFEERDWNEKKYIVKIR